MALTSFRMNTYAKPPGGYPVMVNQVRFLGHFVWARYSFALECLRCSAIALLSLLLLVSSATPKPLRAQSTSVPLPPSAKLPKPKLDRPGFSPIPKFKDIAPSVGLTVPHLSTGEKRYIIESMSGGVGLFDCDDDGRLDIVTVNGSTVDRYQKGGDPMVTLYHQEPDGTFKDITKQAGLTRLGWGMGVAVAD
jgi:hypothetical protein